MQKIQKNGKKEKIKICLCKEEILDTVELILKLTDNHEHERPKMTIQLQNALKRIGGNTLPADIEHEQKEFEDSLDKFALEMGKLCKQTFPVEYKRLKNNNNGIVTVILRYGRNTDFGKLNHMLDMYEKMQTGDLKKLKASYQIGRELRNEFVNPRLNIQEEDVQELDPDTVDMNQIQKEHPHIFK